MSECYEGQQHQQGVDHAGHIVQQCGEGVLHELNPGLIILKQRVGIDVHRRRSVLVRMSETGDKLETIRITNDPARLREVMSRAGEPPRVTGRVRNPV